MQTILVVFHLFLALGLIGLVLMQHGKGADAGAAFGSGASGTVFGASGAANFLSRATALLAALFFVTSLVLAWYAMQSTDQTGLMEEQAAAPAATTLTQPANEVPVIPGQENAVDADQTSVPVIPEQIKQDGVPKPAE